MSPSPTIHASAVLIGPKAVLIRGASGAGKSTLAVALIEAAKAGSLPFARLVGDDRVHIDALHGHLLVRPAANLSGRIEIRGLGIRRLPFEPVAAVGLVVDLAAADAARLPAESAGTALIAGLRLPRLAVAAGGNPLALILAWVGTATAPDACAN